MAAAESRPRGRFRLNPVDRFGRAVDPAVLDAAETLGQRVMRYSEKLISDPAVVANLLDESAAAVSRVLQTKQQRNGAPIRDLQDYLFKAFIRRVNKIVRRRLARNSGSSSSMDLPGAEDLDRKILIEEFLRRCDPVTRDTFIWRVQGFSWREIGRKHGISTHAAESRFGQALQRVRKRLGLKDCDGGFCRLHHYSPPLASDSLGIQTAAMGRFAEELARFAYTSGVTRICVMGCAGAATSTFSFHCSAFSTPYSFVASCSA